MKSQAAAFQVTAARTGDVTMLWDALGTMYVATDAESVGRWLCDLAADPATPRCAFARPSTWIRAAELVVRQLEQSAQAGPRKPDQDATAVHLLVAVHDGAATVWPPAGGPQAVTRRAGEFAALGELVVRLADDPTQPRVPAGAPPDALDTLMQRAVSSLLEGV